MKDWADLLPGSLIAYEGNQPSQAAILSSSFWGNAEPELVRPGAPFFLQLRHTPPDFVTLGAVSLDAWIAARVEEHRDHYLVLLPQVGQIRLDIDQQEWLCLSGQGVICSPFDPYEVKIEGETELLCVRMDRQAVRSSLTGLVGEPVREDPRFFPLLDLADEHLRSFERLVLQLCQETSVHSGPRGGRVFLDQMRQSLITLLLECQYHTLTDLVLQGRTESPYSTVEKAMRFLRAHLEEPLSVEDLAEAAAVSPRTLFRDFKKEMDASPMEALRNERLDRIHQELSTAVTETSVTDVAFRCGFNHLGRLAGFYKDRFGESPSDTLQRARELSERSLRQIRQT